MKILGCPLCGGNATILHYGNSHTKTRKVEIKCRNCNLSLIQKARRFTLEWLEDKVIQTWNTRNGFKEDIS